MKKVKKKEKIQYKNYKKVAKKLLSRVRSSLLETQILYLLLSNLLFRPALQMLWSFALKLSPDGYITTDTINTIFKAPSILIAIVVIAIAIAWWTLYEFSLILCGLDCAWRGEKIKMLSLMKRSAVAIKRALYPQNWLVFIYVAVLIPFTNIFLSSNYISKIQVPEYIAEALEDHLMTKIIYVAVILVLAFLVIIWVLSLHYFILGKKDFRESCKCSFQWIKKHPIKKVLVLLRWSIHVTLMMGLMLIAPAVLFIGGLIYIGIYHEKLMIILWRTWEFVGSSFMGFLLGCIMILSVFAFLSAIYYKEIEEDHSEISNFLLDRHRYRKGGRIFVLLCCVFVIGICGLFTLGASASPEVYKMLSNYVDSEVTITSHRGYSAKAPENTLPSFEAAIEANADCAELDVQMTKDGVVMLTHDTNLKRTTGKDANIYDLTYEQVRKLDAGAFFSEKFSGTKIPTLQEVMDLCKGKIRLNIEIKASDQSPGLESKVAQLIVDNGWVDQCTVTSLSYESLCKVKKVEPKIRCGYILAIGIGNYYNLKNADFFSVEATFVNWEMVNSLHALGKGVSVWTIDRETDAENMRDYGVDDIITGDVSMVRQVLKERSKLEEVLIKSMSELREIFEEADLLE